jgi:hypothetical protein
MRKVEGICKEKCEICGYERDIPHQFVDGLCACGTYQPLVGFYLVGEKPNKSNTKTDNIADILKPIRLKTALTRQQKIYGKTGMTQKA